MRGKLLTLQELQDEVKRLENIRKDYSTLANEALQQFKASEQEQIKCMQLCNNEKERQCIKEMKISAEAKEMYDKKIEKIDKRIKSYKKKIKEMQTE